MPIEICTIGGYKEVGKNCTVLRVDDEVIIFDMGLQLDKYIAATEDDDNFEISTNKLTNAGAIPDLRPINKWKHNVVAIVPSHAHLDHIGAIPFLADKYECDIICTPFTKHVLQAILDDKKKKIRNQVVPVNPNSKYKITDKITVEFLHTTHSTPHTAHVVIHTPYGAVVYANDFKLDNTPILGKPPSYKKMEKLKNVKALIIDSLYAPKPAKTPSEEVARDMLRSAMLDVPHEKGLIVTTFSSHIARLKSIIEFGKKLNRKIVFLGRSLDKYTSAAKKAGIIDLQKEVKICKYRDQIKRELKKINKNKSKYLVVCTGHQGEPKAVLSRMAQGREGWKFEHEDSIIFSCNTIPTPITIANREELERQLESYGVKMFTGIHVSGHGSREDQRMLIDLIGPEHIIPSHCEMTMAGSMEELAVQMGYEPGKTVHIMSDGEFKQL